jgi:hypothetical protein
MMATGDDDDDGNDDNGATTSMATARRATGYNDDGAMTMAADDGDNEVDGNGATGDDVGDGGMGAATGYDDDDAFDGCGVFQRRRRRTKVRWRGQREMQQSNRGDGGPGGNKRSFTDSHLKDLHAVFVQNEMVPRA